jgi:hypothetical protein
MLKNPYIIELINSNNAHMMTELALNRENILGSSFSNGYIHNIKKFKFINRDVAHLQIQWLRIVAARGCTNSREHAQH